MKIENFKKEKIEDVRKEIWDLSQTAQNVSNPNYLLNSDFYFNQRGQSTYTSNSSKFTYTYDRWCLQKSEGTNHCDIVDGKPRYSCSTSATNQIVFGQTIEHPERYRGHTITFWMKYTALKNGSMRLAIQTNTSSFVYGEICTKSSGTAVVTATIPTDSIALVVWVEKYSGTDEWYIEPKEAKMEEGSVPTALTLTNVHQELFNLKRYFINTDALWGRIFVSGPSHLELIVPFNMRTTPSIVWIGYNLYTYNDDGSISSTWSTSVMNVTAYSNYLQFTVEMVNHGIKDGHFCITGLLVDAEIY